VEKELGISCSWRWKRVWAAVCRPMNQGLSKGRFRYPCKPSNGHELQGEPTRDLSSKPKERTSPTNILELNMVPVLVLRGQEYSCPYFSVYSKDPCSSATVASATGSQALPKTQLSPLPWSGTTVDTPQYSERSREHRLIYQGFRS
jgi:hypothetical protein